MLEGAEWQGREEIFNNKDANQEGRDGISEVRIGETVKKGGILVLRGEFVNEMGRYAACPLGMSE